MSYVDQIKQRFKREGQAITKSVLTGIVCPCVDSETNLASEEWHRQNPNAEKCYGTGLIQSTRTGTTIYGFIQPLTMKFQVPERLKQSEIGILDNNSFSFFGAVDGNLNFVSVDGMDERRDWLEYGGEKYVVQDVKKFYKNGVLIYEAARLVKRGISPV